MGEFEEMLGGAHERADRVRDGRRQQRLDEADGARLALEASIETCRPLLDVLNEGIEALRRETTPPWTMETRFWTPRGSGPQRYWIAQPFKHATVPRLYIPEHGQPVTGPTADDRTIRRDGRIFSEQFWHINPTPAEIVARQVAWSHTIEGEGIVATNSTSVEAGIGMWTTDIAEQIVWNTRKPENPLVIEGRDDRG